MKFLLNLKTPKKLFLGFGLCLFFSLVMALVASSKMSAMTARTASIVDGPVAISRTLGQLGLDVKQYRLYEYNYVIAGSDAIRGKELASLEATKADIQKLLTAWEGSAAPEQKGSVGQFRELWKEYADGTTDQLKMAESGSIASSAAKLLARRPSFFKASDFIESQLKASDKIAHDIAAISTKEYGSATTSLFSLLFVSLVVSLSFAAWLSKTITWTIGQVNQRLQSLATMCVKNLQGAIEALSKGDVTATIQTGTTLIEMDQKDEFGLMAKDVNSIVLGVQGSVAAFQTAQASLSEMLAQVRVSANGIAKGAEQVAQGNSDLSARTEQQASSLEETAASMEEMTSTIKQNADNAKLANQLANQAREVAETGGAVVGEAVAAMGAINEGSRRIADIVSVIDEIAFQTNLLALNAAVEAARVGEQGRGFAVVAAEVRSLAQRSASAAKEIKALVQDSVARVEDGSTLVNQSGERLAEIVNSVKRVADVVAEISAASVEQASGVEQVNRAVMLMDQSTQQGADVVQEMAQLSQAMNMTGRTLQTMVNRFTIDDKLVLHIEQTTQQSVELATGTHGRSNYRPSPKLQVVSHGDEFEEF